MKKSILLCIFVASFACKNNSRLIVLEPDRVISQYNDTTFNSTGFITPFSNGYIVGDYMNKFIAITDQDIQNIDIIGKIGNGPDEYAVLPSSYIPINQKIFMYDSKKTIYIYDLQTKKRERLLLDSITPIIRDRYVFRKGNSLIFLTVPTCPYNFVSYNLLNGKIDFFNANKALSGLRNQGRLYTALLQNDIFVIVEYKKREGIMYTFSLTDDSVNEKKQIPFNRALLDIFQEAPDIPAFDGIFGWKNRIFIAYNSTGLITTQINSEGHCKDWTFLDYPEDKMEDHVILGNFWVTDKNMIFVNQGLIRFYKNPF